MKKNWFFSTLIDIRKSYSGFLNILVSISSVFFILWLLLIFFIRDEKFPALMFPLAIFIAIIFLYSEQQEREKNDLYLYNPQKAEKFKKVNDYLRISGSIVFLLLFINLYLKISDFLNQQFLDTWKNIESVLNIFGLVFLYVAAIFLIFLAGFGPWLKFTSFIIKDKEKIKRTGRYSIVLYFIVLYFLFMLAFVFGILIYEKIGWVFGFSLALLHLSYLIKRPIVLFETKTGSNIIP